MTAVKFKEYSLWCVYYAAMAQAEIEKKEKHQREGSDVKKNRGEWDDYGCPAIMSQKEFLEHYEKVLSGELRPFE